MALIDMVIREVKSYPVFAVVGVVLEKRDTGKSIVIGASDHPKHTGFIPDKEGVKYSHKNWTLIMAAGPDQRGPEWSALELGKSYKFYVSMRMDGRGDFTAVVKFWYHGHE